MQKVFFMADLHIAVLLSRLLTELLFYPNYDVLPRSLIFGGSSIFLFCSDLDSRI